LEKEEKVQPVKVEVVEPIPIVKEMPQPVKKAVVNKKA
jgi:hypothetical protein